MRNQEGLKKPQESRLKLSKESQMPGASSIVQRVHADQVGMKLFTRNFRFSQPDALGSLASEREA